MKGETKAVDKPIAKPLFPLPAIFGKSGRNKYSTRVEWNKINRGWRAEDRNKINRGRQPEMATARSKENQ